MPRIARENLKTITTTYHIIIRGVNKQDLFFDDSDKEKYKKIVKEAKEKFEIKVQLYVMMSNHVHIVIQDEKEKMSNFMHKICSTYAMYFNKKYERVGHLFQNRFKSIEVVEESHLLNLIKYIHSNPCKEKMSVGPEYKWSSYMDYIGKSKIKIADTDFILSLFGENKEKALDNFIKYNKEFDEKSYFEIELMCDKKLSDEEAAKYISKVFGLENVLQINSFNKEIRNSYICKIAKIKGIYIEQIARILGISKRNIARIIENGKKK